MSVPNKVLFTVQLQQELSQAAEEILQEAEQFVQVIIAYFDDSPYDSPVDSSSQQ